MARDILLLFIALDSSQNESIYRRYCSLGQDFCQEKHFFRPFSELLGPLPLAHA